MNWDPFKAIAVIATTLVALNQLLSPRFRSKLKDDLQILKLYREMGGHTKYSEMLRSRIDETIIYAYGEKGPYDSRAVFFFGLSIFSVCLCFYVFTFRGLSLMLGFLLIISIGLAFASGRRLRDK